MLMEKPSLLDIGKLLLVQHGDFLATTAVGGPEALQLPEQEKFDTIISDYPMPGMDRIHIFIEVRKDFTQKLKLSV